MLLVGSAELVVSFLAQGIVPAPALELLNEQGRAELAVAHHLDLGAFGHQAAHVGQEGTLNPSLAVALGMGHPGPGNGQGPASIGQGHHQPLMAGAHLGGIQDETDHSAAAVGDHQQPPGQRLIPVPHPHGPVVYPSPQPSLLAQVQGRAGHLGSRPMQVHAAAQENPDHQPTHVAQPSHPLMRTDLFQLRHDGMIESGGGHFPPS